MKTSQKHSKAQWLYLGLVMAGLAGLSWQASGAVYNFYFNNTEQGDNGTASPSLNVESNGKDAKLAQKPESTPAAPEAAPTETPVPAPAPTENAQGEPKSSTWIGSLASGAVNVVKHVAGAHLTERQKHRILVSGVAVHEEQNVGNFIGGDSSGWSNEGSGVLLTYSYHPLSWLGFNMFGGGGNYERVFTLGAEVQLVPVQIGLFGLSDLIHLGAMAGISNMASASSNIASAHLGAALGINLGYQWNLEASIRGNKGFVMGDVGLGFRF